MKYAMNGTSLAVRREETDMVFRDQSPEGRAREGGVTGFCWVPRGPRCSVCERLLVCTGFDRMSCSSSSS